MSIVPFKIDPVKCVMCDACRLACPRLAISVAPVEPTYIIDADACNACHNMSAVRCVPQCPTDAIFQPAS